MSHADEGTLHAYLDGELPSAERAALERHLAECATCRASLAEERALLERASAVLGSARPVESPAPPFEQLRPAPKRSPWRVRRSFAWAASIALALGLGYYLRPAYRAAPQPEFGLYDRTAAAPAPPRHRAAPAADEVAQLREKDSATRVAVRAEPLNQAGAPSANGAAPVPRASPDSISAAASTVVAGALEREERDRPSVSAAKARRADVAQSRQLTAGTWAAINRQTARSLLGEEPVGLPGLAPRSFRRTPDGSVVVEQALDSSTFIQIFQRPASPASLGAFERARSDRLLARFVGRLRVEIAGPVSPDSLNKLLEQVAPLP